MNELLVKSVRRWLKPCCCQNPLIIIIQRILTCSILLNTNKGWEHTFSLLWICLKCTWARPVHMSMNGKGCKIVFWSGQIREISGFVVSELVGGSHEQESKPLKRVHQIKLLIMFSTIFFTNICNNILVSFFFNWQLLAIKLVKTIFVVWSDEPITNHHDHKDRILLTLAQKSWTKTVLSLLPLTILRAFCWMQTIWLLCEGTAWYFLILTQPGTGVAGLAISISQKCK